MNMWRMPVSFFVAFYQSAIEWDVSTTKNDCVSIVTFVALKYSSTCKKVVIVFHCKAPREPWCKTAG